MTCNCKAELEVKLLERLIETSPSNTFTHRVALQGYAYAIGGTDGAVVEKPFMPVKNTVSRIVKKTGLMKDQSHISNMVFSYCPFCGVKV